MSGRGIVSKGDLQRYYLMFRRGWFYKKEGFQKMEVVVFSVIEGTKGGRSSEVHQSEATRHEQEWF